MATRWTRRMATILATASVGLGLAIVTATPAHAAPGDIVINEIMYNAATAGPNPNLEFLELFNRGGTPVDISGWRITDAFTINSPGGVVPAGTSIPAGGYFVIAGDLPSFTARFPAVTPDLTFDPVVSGLAGGGETITLADAASGVIDSVTYDDVAPWPLAPDGGGPSLELVDPFSDNALAASWDASTGLDGTPRAQNSRYLAPAPSLQNVAANPFRPNPNQAVTVQATIPLGSQATLSYRVMFGNVVTIPFLDDAASVGGANNGVYSAVIPGAGAGQLIRYRIDATVAGSPIAYPAIGDSRTYDGVVVTDSELNAASLPVLEFFIDDAGYNGLLRTVCDGVEYPAVITWQGRVFDNSTMRRRGQSSCNDPKPKIEMQLPTGYAIDFGTSASAQFTGPLDEWAFQNENYPMPGLGWENVAAAGDPPLGYMPIRSQRNGDFFGTGSILEEYDGSWRSRQGYASWSLYKVDAGGLRTYTSEALLEASLDLDKKNPDDTDYTDAWQLTQVLNQPASVTKTAWLYANLDIPEMVNYMAITVELRHWDSGGKNFYIARDAGGTGRWRILHWDLDGILSAGSDTKGDFITPDTSFNRLYSSLLEVPAIREMYYRRLRTLHDRYLVGNDIVNRFDAMTVGLDADRQLDRARWGGTSLSGRRQRVVNGVAERRTQIARYTNATQVPTSQAAAPAIVINEIQYNPSPAVDSEFLELYNPSTTAAVDISGWRIRGVGSSDGEWTIPPGTVIPRNGYAVFVSNDAAFRAAFPGTQFVGGQFPGGLGGGGELLQLLDGARVVDEVTYDDVAPWPVEPDGTGPSLELTNPTLDNSLAASWLASTGTGTPNARNSRFGGGPGPGGPGEVLAFGATWRYLDTGVDQGTAWRAPGFVDTAWASGPARLGFQNPGIVTTLQRAQRRTTYYFRTTFNVSGTFTTATLDLLRDDGAVVYLNGNEVARSNMPAGVVSFSTRASTDIGGTAETTPVTLTIPAGSVLQGTNTIAIEVHQIGNAQGDLSMDARLTLT